MGPLNDENELQVDEKNNKSEKFEKFLKTVWYHKLYDYSP